MQLLEFGGEMGALAASELMPLRLREEIRIARGSASSSSSSSPSGSGSGAGAVSDSDSDSKSKSDSLGRGPAAVYLPTGALRLFQSLHDALPGHCLIAADFNALPPPAPEGSTHGTTVDTPVDSYIDAANPPIVSTVDK